MPPQTITSVPLAVSFLAAFGRLSFKDVGARFMSRCLGYFSNKEDRKKVTVLVATSGDTGGAGGDNDSNGPEACMTRPPSSVKTEVMSLIASSATVK